MPAAVRADRVLTRGAFGSRHGSGGVVRLTGAGWSSRRRWWLGHCPRSGSVMGASKAARAHFLLLVLALAGCAAVVSPEKVAELRALEAESAARLVAEGEALYGADRLKRDGFQYCELALGLMEEGELRRGIREASKAVFLGRTRGDDYLLAFAKRDLAYAYSLAGNLERARQFADEAIEHMRRSPRGTPAQVLGPSYKIRGDVHVRQGRVREAIGDYQQALETSPERFQSFVRVALANAHLAAGNVTRARELFREAEVGASAGLRPLIRRGLGNVAIAEGGHQDAVQLFTEAAAASAGPDRAYHRLWALDGVARARLAAGDRDGAIEAYLRAVAAAEQVRVQFRSEEFKTGFFADIQQIFDDTVALLGDAGRTEAAFEVSERGRGRALLDLIRGRVKASAGAEAFADPLGRPVSASQARAALPEGVVLVQYHVFPRWTRAWVIRSSAVTTVTVDVSREALARSVRGFVDAIRARATDGGVGADLYSRLVRPLGLREFESLVVVPHGVLHYLPFHALRGPRGYLIEERAISYAPSASALVHLLRRERAPRRQVLALGNPDLGTPALALPGAEREVERIKELFPGAEVYVRRDATKERMLSHAPRSELLHVAAHAEVDEIDPLYSVVRLARTEKVPGELEAHEVYRMDLARAGLVVLSACDTGRGRVSRGDELWGFSRAFLSAGARGLLLSLWPVEDESTARLMGRFYETLGEGAAHHALRMAQLELLGDGRFAHPFFWAPFVLVGDWR